MANPIFQFNTAKRQKAKASIVIEGLSGSGKSGLALLIGEALASDPSKVYAVDTENKSLNLYDGIRSSSGTDFGGFQVFDFTPEIGFKPSNYLAAREAAVSAGAEVLIQDSISHAWAYKGGVLDMVSELKQSNQRYQRDSYAAWGDEAVVKEKNMLNQMIRDARVHVISTVRVKERLEYDRDAAGRASLVSLGETQIMQADLKYEPDLVLTTLEPGTVTETTVKYPKVKITKSRYPIFEVGQIYEMTPELINQLKVYLEEGADPQALLDQQKAEYVRGVGEWLDAHQKMVPIWNQLKKDAGYENVKLTELPLATLKELYIKIAN